MTATAKKVLTYLLVEDDENHASIIRECIQHGDMCQNVRHVASGEDCLRYLNGEEPFTDRQMYPYPDVVLLDIRMPGMLDGLQTLQIIRADYRHRGLAVMILTTSDREQDIDRAYELGVNGYIVKSGDTSQMIEQLLWVRWSFDSLLSLPDHFRQLAMDRPLQSNTQTHPSVPAQAFLVSNEETALNMLASIYRENRKDFQKLLQSLEDLDTVWFANLVCKFSLQHDDLFITQKEIDWDFIRQSVVKKLPQYLSAKLIAEVAESITAAINDRDRSLGDDELPFLHDWQEF